MDEDPRPFSISDIQNFHARDEMSRYDSMIYGSDNAYSKKNKTRNTYKTKPLIQEREVTCMYTINRDTQ